MNEQEFHNQLVAFLNAFPGKKQNQCYLDVLSHLHRWKQCCDWEKHPNSMETMKEIHA